MPYFSIIIVSLNAGSLIDRTIKSALEQIETDYEIIIKDGMSKDDTLNYIPQNEKIKVISEPDTSLYDAMNQAISYATGKYCIFMNCGDSFASVNVLQDIKRQVGLFKYGMVYGNYARDGVIRKQPSNLSDYYLYRTPLCHQSVFFETEILKMEEKYDIRYRILADYNLELYIFKNHKVYHSTTVVCDYLGGGISETKEGRKKKLKERRKIITQYYSKVDRLRYFIIWKLSFPTIRGIAANSKNRTINKIYHSIVNKINK